MLTFFCFLHQKLTLHCFKMPRNGKVWTLFYKMGLLLLKLQFKDGRHGKCVGTHNSKHLWILIQFLKPPYFGHLFSLVCQVCYNKVTDSWLKQEFIFTQLWGLEVQERSLASLLACLLAVFSHDIFSAPPPPALVSLCVQISSSHKDSRQTGLGFTLMASF